MENYYELVPQFDARQSFYRKAFVKINGSVMTLYSYETKVAEIKEGLFQTPSGIMDTKRAEVFMTHSPTTLRHIKEFLKQNDFKAENKSQIETDYIQ